ncbi:MAG: hypothetical protein M1549_03805, partial [Candidatus Dependentiae bacterium]|nr:hypothetical protein [Candidatus Dependentiae bacterium]
TEVMILNSYPIYADAYGVIRQDGLLGTKYVEIIPGDPHVPRLHPGGILMRPSKDPVALDVMLGELHEIAKNIQEVSASLKNVFAGDAGTQRLERAVDSFGAAAERASDVVSSIGNVVSRNERTIDEVVHDLRDVIVDVKREIPALSASLRDGVTLAANTIDRDLSRLAHEVEATTQPLSTVVQKINDGNGLLGKLVSDDELGHNFSVTVDGLKKYFSLIDRFAVIFDVHGETMYAPGNDFRIEDGKGYFHVRMYPNEDYFYIAGVVGMYSGTIQRYHKYREWYNDHGCQLNPDDMDKLGDIGKLWFARKKRCADS